MSRKSKQPLITIGSKKLPFDCPHQRQCRKKRLQFSQKMTLGSSIFSMVIVVAVLAANFMLLWFGKQAMPQETITTITVYGGITSTLTFGGYCVLSGVRDCSLNKTKTESSGGQTDASESEDDG